MLLHAFWIGRYDDRYLLPEHTRIAAVHETHEHTETRVLRYTGGFDVEQEACDVTNITKR